ncbi:MAG: DNA repair protein RecO [Armatimonadetes bacterium]|nr:DNA repair protein RecO [Armatimonadota bacterium]
MPSYTATALVIHRNNLAENDCILTLYTSELGKISAVAKGARKPTSRFSGATELFTVFHGLFATGRTLDILTQCEIVQAYTPLRYDLDRLARATYFCEVLDRFTMERDPVNAEALFQLTTAALRLLQETQATPDVITHAYELRLLGEQGYSPICDACVKCGREIVHGQVGFSPSLGGVLCSSDRYKTEDSVPLSAEALEALQLLPELDGEELLDFHPSRKALQEVGRALRWYIKLRAERAIKSADFLDQLRANQ